MLINGSWAETASARYLARILSRSPSVKSVSTISYTQNSARIRSYPLLLLSFSFIRGGGKSKIAFLASRRPDTWGDRLSN
jgi:hypothetical protein